MKTFDKQEENNQSGIIRGYFADATGDYTEADRVRDRWFDLRNPRPDIQGAHGPILLWEVALTALGLTCFIILPYILALFA